VIPAWLRRTGAICRRLLAIAGLAGVTIWLAVVLGTVTVSVLLSLIVAATFAPIVRRLRARGTVLYVMGERPPLRAEAAVEERAEPPVRDGAAETLGALPAD
jgi:hypothetical protein